MGIGYIISLVFTAFAIVIILLIAIPMDKKYIVRENRKINFKKTTIYMRWNVFDTLTVCVAAYTIICVQLLNVLIMSGETIDNPWVQFFTNQAQAWVIVTVAYFATRVSLTLKSIKAHYGEQHDVD